MKVSFRIIASLCLLPQMMIVGCGGSATVPEAGVAKKKAATPIQEKMDMDMGVGSIQRKDVGRPANPVNRERPDEGDPVFRESKTISENYEDGKPKRKYDVNVYDLGPPRWHGRYQEWYPNGQLWVAGAYDDGKMIGEWKFWEEDGTLVKKGSYQNGVPVGQWTYHRPDATRWRTENYVDGEADGEWIKFDRTGNTAMEMTSYHTGKNHGKHVVWQYPDDKTEGEPIKVSEENFVDGVRNGDAKTWHLNGQLKQLISFRNGKTDGKSQAWDPDGKLILDGNFRDGKQIK